MPKLNKKTEALPQNFLVKNLTNCEVVPLDVSNIESVNDCLNYSKPDTVIHAAATKFVDLSEKFPFECIDINIVIIYLQDYLSFMCTKDNLQ